MKRFSVLFLFVCFLSTSRVEAGTWSWHSDRNLTCRPDQPCKTSIWDELSILFDNLCPWPH